MHDLVIRNGRLVDGTGTPARTADVAVDGDRIVEVGGDVGPGRREIDADGRLVTPGWVDVHTHYDGQATWDPEVSPSGWHGVTTVVMGNCGVGFAPARPSERDWLIQLMEGVEDIPGAALHEGMTWNWETFPEYLDEVERLPRVLDVAALLPHGALRAYVLGEGRGNDVASAEEVVLMAKLAREAVEAGAVGISTTRTMLHRAKDGELAAGTTAAADELIALGEALGGVGHRVFSVASDMLDLDHEIGWMAEISKRAHVPVTFQTLQTDLAPDWWRTWIDGALEANRQGAWLVPQVAGKPASILVGFESSFHPFVRHAAYQAIADLPLEEQLAALRTAEVRDAILAEDVQPAGPEAFLFANFQKLFPLGDPPNYEPAPEDSIGAIAEREGRSPLEVAYDLMLQRDGHELLYLPILGYANGGLWAIDEMLRHPATVLGLGDGGAHCGVLCDASLPTFMLTHWARDRSRGERLPLELVVAHQTSRTAALYGFADRGTVAPGFLADLNVIDYDGLALDAPEMAYDLPAGGKRLIQRARGYGATVKSGVVVRQDDQPTGERPGGLSPRRRRLMGERTVRTNGIDLHVTEDGEGSPVILCHGFPELGYSWRHQIPALAAAGYHVVVPDQRGYGQSSKPDAIDEYDIVHLTDDLLGLLDDLGHEKAVFIGHDWGSMVVWGMSLLHPDRVAGVMGMSVPFIPRGERPPTESMRFLFGDAFFYMLYFQEPGVADANLAADPERTMRGMLAGLSMDNMAGGDADPGAMFAADDRGFVERLPNPEKLPGWLSQDELDHYVAEFTRTGFTGGINWYRNLDRNWEQLAGTEGDKVRPPAAFLGGAQDPVLMMTPPWVADGWLADDRGSLIVEGAGHWVQQEKPDEVNAFVLKFLAGLTPGW